jgi:hypothetical protein
MKRNPGGLRKGLEPEVACLEAVLDNLHHYRLVQLPPDGAAGDGREIRKFPGADDLWI